MLHSFFYAHINVYQRVKYVMEELALVAANLVLRNKENVNMIIDSKIRVIVFAAKCRIVKFKICFPRVL